MFLLRFYFNFFSLSQFLFSLVTLLIDAIMSLNGKVSKLLPSLKNGTSKAVEVAHTLVYLIVGGLLGREGGRQGLIEYCRKCRRHDIVE